jgi:hypothetical protein
MRVLLACAALVACAGGAGCGGQDSGALAWSAAPLESTVERLPGDHVLTGEVRNDSLRVLELRSRDVRLVDAGGDAVEGGVAFLSTFARGPYPRLYPDVEGAPAAERRRAGRSVRIEPGGAAPLAVTWRERPGGAGRPVRIAWRGGSLAVP